MPSNTPINDKLPLDTSEYYGGLRGKTYFARQNLNAQQTAIYNKEFFKRFISPQDSVLDFGCGGGHLLRQLPGKRKVGIDINPAALEVAQSNGIETYSSLDAVEGELLSCVISSHAIEHVSDPYGLLLKLKKNLEPDGLLLWLSPMDDWHNTHQRVWKANDFDMHLYSWTPLTIGNLVTAAGYKLQSVETITHAIPPRIAHRLWRLNKRLFHIAAYIWATFSNRRQLFVVAKAGTD